MALPPDAEPPLGTPPVETPPAGVPPCGTPPLGDPPDPLPPVGAPPGEMTPPFGAKPLPPDQAPPEPRERSEEDSVCPPHARTANAVTQHQTEGRWVRVVAKATASLVLLPAICMASSWRCRGSRGKRPPLPWRVRRRAFPRRNWIRLHTGAWEGGLGTRKPVSMLTSFCSRLPHPRAVRQAEDRRQKTGRQKSCVLGRVHTQGMGPEPTLRQVCERRAGPSKRPGRGKSPPGGWAGVPGRGGGREYGRKRGWRARIGTHRGGREPRRLLVPISNGFGRCSWPTWRDGGCARPGSVI